MFSVIDTADLPLVLPYAWHVVPSDADCYYAASVVWILSEYRCRHISMHRSILGFSPGDPKVDHVDHDGLNNRRQNLRPCTDRENQRNRRAFRGLKGIQPTPTGRYVSRIWINGKNEHLGTFDEPEDAARAYDKAAKEHFGEFACVNFG